jgi:hypothetical protein
METHCALRDQREHRVYKQLLRMAPGLEERILTGSDEDVNHVVDMVSNTIPSIMLTF